ncbi:MAG: 4-hydroxy-tetrahydrodipicolinate reductase [Acidobacteria bacterium]|jgi:4-hydroxy-tetrahydrodipicolinate reductase|nr:4-hydroxy-tetrahydrodipicolinate reductase [Acidobacteriota bacterium]
MSADRPLHLALVGCGRMGRALALAAEARGHRIALRVDPESPGADARGVDRADLAGIDVALEFTHAAAAPQNVRRLLEAGCPAVSGTTGWNDGLEAVRALAAERGVGFLWAPNFALGVQALFRVADRAASLLGAIGGFAPYLVEEHHQLKRDAPSGTALRLAQALVERTPGKTRWGLAPADGPLPPELVPVAWVRAGEIPGTHRLGWDGPGETIEIVHRARDRAVFAHGAVRAAEWLVARPGPRTLDEMIDELLGDASH